MTFKTHLGQAAIELAALKQAMLQAKLARGDLRVTIVNDPEDPEMLAPYRRRLDQTKTFSIGPAEFPGHDWYCRYQEAAKRGDEEETRGLLEGSPSPMKVGLSGEKPTSDGSDR
jgi:hypothetical protein